MISYIKINKADTVGILNSSLCIIHCVATPLLLSFGSGFLSNPFLEYLFLIIAFISIYKTTNAVTNRKIVMLLWVAFWGFLFSTLFEDEYSWLQYSSYFFALLIIIGHILNIRHCKKCSVKTENES